MSCLAAIAPGDDVPAFVPQVATTNEGMLTRRDFEGLRRALEGAQAPVGRENSAWANSAAVPEWVKVWSSPLAATRPAR